MQYADRLRNLGTEMAFSVLQQIQNLPPKRREHIISFAIGEPDFNTPEHIKNAAIDSLRSNRTHYTPSAGIPELRQAIANYYTNERNFTGVGSENVCVLSSAKLVINFSILTCTNPGDEVVYPNPGYPVYESQAKVFGCKPIPALLIEEEEFGFDIDRLRNLVTDRTRMIIINNPSNPCGSVLASNQLEALREIALENDLWIVSDEIYSNFVYDGRFRSIAELPDMAERTIILDGFSKYYAMTGWRLGYAISNPDVIRNFSNWATNTISCSPTFVQDAGVTAMTADKASSNAMVQQFKRRRDLICELINDIEGISCVVPKGAFYVFANVTEACSNKNLRDSSHFQERLLDEQDVAVLSRDYFGSRDPDETQEYVRFSYCVSQTDIEEGIARVKKFVEG